MYAFEANDPARPIVYQLVVDIVEGVPAFWEDKLFDDRPTYGQRLAAASVELVAVAPVHRCIVPSREPSTVGVGTPTPKFIEEFQLNRRRTMSPSSSKRLTGAKSSPAYHLCTSTNVLTGGCLRVGERLVEAGFIQLAVSVDGKPLTPEALRELER